MAWEDDITLEWDVYLSNDDISKDGYVNKAVGGYAVGPMPKDKQLVIILPKRVIRLGENNSGRSRSRGHLVVTRHPGHMQTGQSG